jgi:peptide/nickel transport system substrate-binding protein
MLKIRTLALATAACAMIALPASAQTLKWGSEQDIGSLDPYSYGSSFTINVLNNVYEGLVRFNRNLKIEPALATSWDILDDKITWRFHLRKGVRFHNGNAFTAEDVAASLARVSHKTSPLKGNLPAFVSSKVVDDHTIDIKLNGTYPLLLPDLTNIHIFDKEWLVKHNAELPTDAAKKIEGYPTLNANGTGPFIVESREPDAKTVMVVNKKWWDKPEHNLTRIELMPITSAATRVAALLSGEINFTNSAPVQDLPRLAASPSTKVLERTDLRTIMLGFNRRETLVEGGKNPMNDLRVRQAMYQAINMEQIQSKVMRGKSRNTGSLVAPEIPGYIPSLDKRLPFDPEKAKALLAEAGYADGFSFIFNCQGQAGYVNEEEICLAITSMWARVGLKPKLDIASRAVQRPKRTSGKTDVFTLGWATLPMLDAYSPLLQILHSKEGNFGVFNWGGWSYPKLDALVEQAGKELNTEKRLSLETEALQIAKDEIILIPLHQQPLAWAVGKDVGNMPVFPDNKPRPWYVKM